MIKKNFLVKKKSWSSIDGTKVVFTTLFLLAVICSSIFVNPVVNFDGNSSHPDEELTTPFFSPNESSGEFSNQSVSNYDKLIREHPYEFSTYFYETTDYEKVYNESYFESRYVEIDDSAFYYNDSIINLDTSERYSPSANSFTIYNGDNTANGTLDSLDADYSTWDAIADFIPVSFNSTEGDLFKDYLGTLSFTNDAVGSNPSYSGFGLSETGGTINVIHGVYDHSKVVELHDTSGTDNTWFDHDFADQPNGTVEWYWRITDATDYLYAHFDRGKTECFTIRILDDKFQFHNGSWNDVGLNASDNVWYHMRVDYEGTTGNYQNLGEFEWHVYINDVLYGDYVYNENGDVSALTFGTYDPQVNYYGYVDAVDYSWESGYYFGRNKNYTYEFDVFLEDIDDNYLSVISNDTGTLEIETSINIVPYDNLALNYSHMTNLSVQINFSIWNYDSSNWELINSSINNIEFYQNSFVLNESYWSSNQKILLKYYGNHTNLFELYIDELIVPLYSLNLTCYVDFSELNELLEIKVESYYKTDILTTLNFSIWNYNTSEWILINSSLSTSIRLNYYMNDTNYVNNLINQDGRVLFNFNSYNLTAFEFSLDCFNITMYRKLYLTFTKSFSLYGLWKYKWHVVGSSYSSNWSYFYIIDQNNVELISESEYYTRWDFVNETIGIASYLYNETFLTGSDAWTLSGDQQIRLTNDNAEDYLGNITDYALNVNLISSYLVNHQSLPYYDEAYAINYWLGQFIVDCKYGRFKLYDENFQFLATWDLDGGTDNIEDSFYYNKNASARIWIADANDKKIYYYDQLFDVKGSYILAHKPRSIYHDGTNWWISSDDTLGVYKYDNNWNLITTYSITEDTQPYGIYRDIDNDYWWILGNQNDKLYLYYDNWSYTGKSFSLPSGNWNDLLYRNRVLYLIDKTAERVYKYSILVEKNKIEQLNSLLWIQTNTTETLTLRSPDTLNLDLEKGNRIEIVFNTSSTNRINLNLRHNGINVKSFKLSPEGNTIFTTQTKTYILDEDITIDQIEFTGIFDEETNLIIDSIQIYEMYEEIDVFYVEPFGRKEIYLSFPYNFTVEVYEENIKVETFYLETAESLTTLIYEAIKFVPIYISYYDINNEYLEFQHFITYVNYTLDELNFVNERLSENILNVDEDSYIDFMIYDSFNVLIKSTTITEQTFADITLDVFTLKIKNKAIENVDYTLSNPDSEINKTGILFPDEIDTYSIATGNYSLRYINYEDELVRTFDFVLIANKLITINTTTFDIYFSIFNFDGLGLTNEIVRFYINNERKDFGFNTLLQDTNRLTVLDYFNETLFDSNVNLRQYTEYNILVEVYTLILNNNYTHSIYIEIERNDIELKQIIPSQSSISLRFLPDITYEIEYFHINGTKIGEIEIKLDKNNKIVSFGFYEVEVPISPLPILNSVQLLIWFGFFIMGIAIVIIILYFRIRGIGNPTVSEEIRSLITKQTRKKRRSKKVNPYDNRDVYMDV